MRKSDFISGLLLTALGMVTLFVIIPDQIGSRSFGGLPPDFFPRILAAVFLGLALILVAVRGFALLRRLPSTETDVAPFGWLQGVFIVAASAYLFVTFWLMANLGFIWAGLFAIGGAAAVMGEIRHHPLRWVGIAVLGSVGIYFGFRHLFLVFLPA